MGETTQVGQAAIMLVGKIMTIAGEKYQHIEMPTPEQWKDIVLDASIIRKLLYNQD